MDDLSGLSWNSNSTSKPNSNAPPKPTGANYSSFSTPPLRATPSPLSATQAPLPIRTTTPSSLTSSGSTPAQPKKLAADPFANLAAFSKTKSTNNNNLTLQEKQKQLEAERAKKEAEQRAKLLGSLGSGGNAAAYGDGSFWDTLGSGRRASPAPSTVAKSTPQEEEDDILAAFNSSAPVNTKTHFPPPSASLGNSILNAPVLGAQSNTSTPLAEDDDPFGLATFQAQKKPAVQVSSPAAADDFDILGDLAKPVSEIQIRDTLTSSPAPEPQRRPSPLSKVESAEPKSEDKKPGGWDAAIAEIVDMGFSVDQAKEALSHTATGTDVEIAVGWLLTEAHRKSKPSSSREPERAGRSGGNHRSRSGSRARSRDPSAPAWANGGNARGEKDIAAVAAEVGSSLFKSANSLWNQGKKKAAQAMKEFQEPNGPSDGRPKWMQEQERAPPRRSEKPPLSPAEGPAGKAVTDEAMMLELGMDGPPRKMKTAGPPLKSRNPFAAEERKTDAQLARIEKERELRRREQEMMERELAARKKRQEMLKKADEEPATGYVSPHRRRGTPKPSTPKPEPERSVLTEPDLLEGASAPPSRPFSQRPAPQPQAKNPFQQPSVSRTASPAAPRAVQTPPAPRKAATQRIAVQCSPSVLAASASDRFAGSTDFKRGDYTSALEKYNKALSPLPSRHLERIIVLSNRSACLLKLGNPKAAINDCEEILSIVGPARGEGETIKFSTESGGLETKPMKDYWSRALMRKAEALEQMEKYQDALELWSMAVSSNVGGASSAAGKRRCEAALKPKPAPAAKPPAPKRPAPKPSSAPSAAQTAAVSKLREQHQAQSAAEAERFALLDQVEARVAAWKGPTEPNLRALIANMEKVLWPEAGWKKVGMHELVMANKVKIQYMKAISKVHPDKLSQNATTEQRMISAAVFSTLNECWDKFKAENGL